MRQPSVILLLIVACITARDPRGGSAQDQSLRDSWQRVPEVFAKLGVKEGAVVADVGAGTGYFTERLSRAVGPTGRVYAVDIEPGMLTRLHELTQRESLSNVEIVAGTATAVGLPPRSMDGVLVVDAYHEMTEHVAMLGSIRQALKPTGRLVMMDKISPQDAGRPRAEQTKNHHLELAVAFRELRSAGFIVTDQVSEFIRDVSLGSTSYWLVVATPGLQRR